MTYIPQDFQVSNEETLQEFMRLYPFATIVSSTPEETVASHVPVITRSMGKTLVIAGHLARANHHWKLMNASIPALVVFHGPHGYISPTWYESTPAVPTWNYGVVHAHGLPTVKTEEAFIRGVLKDLVERHEGNHAKSWRPEMTPAQYYDQMLRAIVGFELPVTKLEGKFKLGQNRSAADRHGVIAALEDAHSPEATRLAEFMRRWAGA